MDVPLYFVLSRGLASRYRHLAKWSAAAPNILVVTAGFLGSLHLGLVAIVSINYWFARLFYV